MYCECPDYEDGMNQKLKKMKKQGCFIILIFWAIILNAQVSGSITSVKDSEGSELGVNNNPQLGEVYTVEFEGENIKDFHIKLGDELATVTFHTGEMPDEPSDSNIDVYVGSFSSGDTYWGGPPESPYLSLIKGGAPISSGQFQIRFNSGTPGKTTHVIFTSHGGVDPFVDGEWEMGDFEEGVSLPPTLISTEIIPTLSEWGVIILILLTVAVGMVFLYIRQTALSIPGGMQVNMPGIKPRLFDKKLYAKVLMFALLAGLGVLGLLYVYFGEITSADPFGTFVSMAIVAYMVHFALLNRKTKVANKE